MPETIYDVAIMGAGPGGYTAAIRAGQLGLKVCLIEKDERLGGTCLQVGCIPTKALLFNAEVYDHLKAAQEYGIDGVTSPKLNWKTIQDRKNKIVTKHTKGLDFLMRKNKVTVVHGFAKLTGPAKNGVHSIEVSAASGISKVETRNVILATGSFARMLPGLKADDRILTNIEVLSLSDIPKSMVIIGCGAVGVEFASIFRTFGAEVTLLEALPRLVPLEDEDISPELERAFKKKGVRVETEAKVESVKKDAKGATVTFKDKAGKPQSVSAEKVLIAVGRRPLTENIGLEKTKVRLDRGYILANAYLETDEPRVYAIGDVVAGLPQLAHAASMEGIIAVGRMAGKDVQPFDRKRCPNATYCEPQIGSVGLTEKQARDAGYDVKTGKFPFVGNSKATILGQHEGFIKVVAEAKYGEILGVHAIGPLATEIIAEPVTALGLEATLDDMAAQIHAHPTVWEALGDAFNSVRGLTINY